MFESFLIGAIAMGVVYLFGCVGEILIEKGGNLNLGIPGIMSLGALGGAVGVNFYYTIASNPEQLGFLMVIISIIFSGIFAALGGLIYAFLTINLQANQNVTGLVLTTFGVGITKFFASKMDNSHFREASNSFKTLFVGYEKLGWFGNIFLSYGILVYIAIILAILVSLFLKKTRTGLFLRSIGESPQTADAQGINVKKYKYITILVGCAIAGLGGLYYVMDRTGGSTFADANIEAFGWLAVALVIFSTWKPSISILGSIVFGGLYILPTFLNITDPNLRLYIKLFDMLPYLVTVIVLIITSALKTKNSQPPKSLGVNYFREER